MKYELIENKLKYGRYEKIKKFANGEWNKSVFNKKGQKIIYISSFNFWDKFKYNKNGDVIKYESSNDYDGLATLDKDYNVVEWY